MRRIRLSLALIGMGLAVIAVARDDKRITWAAIAVLAVALALRFVNRPPPKDAEEEPTSR